MKLKFKKRLNFIVFVGIVLFSIVFASVMYRYGYIMSGNFLSVLSGSYLLKMMMEYPEASMYYKLKKRLYTLAFLYKEALKDFLEYNDIIIVAMISIFVVILSFSPLTVVLQWFLVVFFTIILFTFKETLKMIK